MKRIHLILMTSMILALSFTGCGSTEVAEKPSIKKEVQKESKTESNKKAEKKENDSPKMEANKNASDVKKEETNSTNKNTSSTSSSSTSSSKPANTPAPNKPAPEASKPAPEPSKPAPTPEPSKPAPQPTPQPAPEPPVVNHYWNPEMVEEQVWVEDYTEKIVCGCGAHFDTFDQWDQHNTDGCMYGYTVTTVPSGGHYETQMVPTGRYICSGCGAVK